MCEQAKDWSNIMLALYERDGWTLVDDSHTEKVSPSSSQSSAPLPSSASGIFIISSPAQTCCLSLSSFLLCATSTA